jgi:YggT family protein
MALTLANLVTLIFRGFELLIIARILLSWLNPDPYSPIVQGIHNLTEPILAPVRRRLPPTGMFDLSPMVVLLIAVILNQIVVQLILTIFPR